jgi:polysaccharide pyruvyl transferase CsaB
MTSAAPAGAPHRVVAIGYQGFGNVGDEAILTGIQAILAGSGVTVGWVACGPEPSSVAAFPDARRLSVPRLLPSAAAIRALARSSGLLLGGGGLIHDHWPTVIPRYLLWIVLARALGKRVVWLGVGVGPIRRRTQRSLARIALRLSAAALVRDDESAALLGGVGPKVTVIPDPALFNPSGPPVDRHPTRIGLVVRGPIPTSSDDPAALARRIVAVVEGLRARGREADLLTMGGPADDAFARTLSTEAARRNVALEIGGLGPTPAAALEAIGRYAALVSIRLHGLVLSAVAGVPCVPVAYDAKVRSAADALGLAEAVIDLDELAPETVLERLEGAMTPEDLERVAARVAAMRARKSEISGRVVRAFTGPGR